MARRRRKSSGTLAPLAWIGFLLVVVVVYMVNHNRIQQVLRNTGFIEVVFEDRLRPEPSQPAPTTPATPATPATPVVPTAPATPAPTTPTDLPSVSPPSPAEPAAAPPANTTPTVPTPQPTTTVVVPTPAEAPTEAPPNQLRASLYFVRLGDDGVIYPAAVERRVRYTTSPLTETVRALLAGPTVEDLNQGVITLIPERTQLLSANVQGAVAYLNFNEAFRFNDFGAEGTWAQLQQVVYTATNFQTVRAVQIMIEGKVLAFLSGDGVFVGEPLTRDSF